VKIRVSRKEDLLGDRLVRGVSKRGSTEARSDDRRAQCEQAKPAIH